MEKCCHCNNFKIYGMINIYIYFLTIFISYTILLILKQEFIAPIGFFHLKIFISYTLCSSLCPSVLPCSFNTEQKLQLFLKYSISTNVQNIHGVNLYRPSSWRCSPLDYYTEVKLQLHSLR